jgi:anti-sigma regulatory factor (Ser/Thr protein kinase)
MSKPSLDPIVRERAEQARARSVALRAWSTKLIDEIQVTSHEGASALLGKRDGWTLGGSGDTFALRLARLPELIAVARHDLRRWLEQRNVAREDVGDIVLALSEACANAVEHPDDPTRPAFEVKAMMRSPDEVEVLVLDYGSWTQAHPASAEAVDGRGIGMIRALMDEVEISSRESGKGTTIRMCRRLHCPPVH